MLRRSKQRELGLSLTVAFLAGVKSRRVPQCLCTRFRDVLRPPGKQTHTWEKQRAVTG